GRLRAHRFHRARRRTDERDAFRLAGRGELAVLGEEAVARMYGVGARALRDVEDLVEAEIAVRRGGGADGVRPVRRANVERGPTRLAVDGDRTDAHLTERADDADRDLTAVCDHDLLEHGSTRYHGRVAGGIRRSAASPSQPGEPREDPSVAGAKLP